MLSDFYQPSWQEEVASIAFLLPFGMAVGAGFWLLVRRWAGSRAARYWVAGGALTVGLIVLLRELSRLIRFYDSLSFTPATSQVAYDVLRATGMSLAAALLGTFSAVWVSFLYYEMFPTRRARPIARQ